MRLVTIAREGVLRVDGAPLGGAAGALADDPNRLTFSSAKDPAAKTYARALRLLTLRARTVHELRGSLLEKGEPAENVEPVLSRLTVAGLLNDAKFAEDRARAQLMGKARSRRRLEHDLAARGVPREVASAAIRRALVVAETTEADVAEQAARRKHRALARLPLEEQRVKLFAYLARQGHPADAARDAVRKVLGTR
ncbi:MAG: regulatory protein RecX [Myxococcales bacterium]|nr:regulatory protein RecX [Myxococcales bacterium]